MSKSGDFLALCKPFPLLSLHFFTITSILLPIYELASLYPHLDL